MENTSFKNSLFGGFNRQDVIDYIESASRKSSESIAALEADCSSLRDELSTLQDERDTLAARVQALEEELAAILITVAPKYFAASSKLVRVRVLFS